jgi:hypothetical protein
VSDPVLKTLGRYEIQGEIGRGMMGVVYRALDPALGRVIALKTVHLAFAVPEAERKLYEQRFLTEANVAAVLSHPAIVVVHDVGRDPAAAPSTSPSSTCAARPWTSWPAASGPWTGGRPCGSRRRWPRAWTTPTPTASCTAT